MVIQICIPKETLCRLLQAGALKLEQVRALDPVSQDALRHSLLQSLQYGPLTGVTHERG